MTDDEARQYKKMILTPPGRLIFRLAVPTVISMLITMIYNLVDAYFVGRLGTSASAAIGILVNVNAGFQAFGFMYGQGSGSKIARLLAAGKKGDADRILTVGLTGALLTGLVLTAFVMAFLRPIIYLLGSTDTIYPYAHTYAFYVLLSAPVLCASCVLNNVMRYEGRAFFAMFGLVSGGVLNMILDPVLMFGCGLGIKGAALSTMISQYVSFLILLSMFLRHKTISAIKLSCLRLPLRELMGDALSIIKTGLPSLIRQLFAVLSNATLNNCSKPYDDPAIAAMTIDGRVLMFIASAMIGIGQGFQPVSAFNYGSKKFKRLRRSIFVTWRAGTIIMFALAVAGFTHTADIIRIFLKDEPETVDMVLYYGVPALRFMCVSVVLQPVSVVGNMLFQSIGEARVSSFLSSLRSGLCYIPCLLILPHFLGFTGIQCSQMCADIMAVVITLPFMIRFLGRIPDEDQRTPQDEKYEEYVG
ncbi:MAG: MATE family efflux transporter [Lachnospiraceae bacterium]|nr:MATE family efflux transporter [Lachnospiraceae bacterium]